MSPAFIYLLDSICGRSGTHFFIVHSPSIPPDRSKKSNQDYSSYSYKTANQPVIITAQVAINTVSATISPIVALIKRQ